MADLKFGDLYEIPGDKPGRVWVVEQIGPGSATVRPYTKKKVEGFDGRSDFMAMDGKRIAISAKSDVRIVGSDTSIRLPRWMKKQG